MAVPKHHEKKKVFVALSGGVDSAVAALLLKKQGYAVTGVYMENWSWNELTPHCTTEQDRRDALRVAHHLRTPFVVMNFEKEYRSRVVEYFYHEYAAGRTPNPDIQCNKHIKFRFFLDAARKLGADRIATGHYARLIRHEDGVRLMKGHDAKKDQSYFLALLSQEQLRTALFPIGDLTKTEVRERARSAQLPVAEKPDSQGICFVGQVNIGTLLRQRFTQKPGPIQNAFGATVGEHEGLAYYTIGQRQGLGVGGSGVPYYVAKKIPETNTLVVAHGNQDPILYDHNLVASDAHWISGRSPMFPYSCSASIRYRQIPQPVTLIPHAHGQLFVLFRQRQRAITPGQTIVFYDHATCLGGATIEAAGR